MLKNSYNFHIHMQLQNLLINNKWIIFVFILWSVTFISYTSGVFSEKSSITVVGNSTEQVQNQIANYSLYINTKDSNRNNAINRTNSKSDRILQKLREYGIQDENIKIANMNIYLDQNYIDNTIIEGDWNASVNIDITISDISKVDELTALLSSLDVNNFYGPNFSTDTVALDETQLIELALKDAKNKAEKIANKMNKRLSKVVSITEDTSDNYQSFPRLSALGGTEFLPGSTNVYKTVVVTYEIY